jgi:hypothetical protein
VTARLSNQLGQNKMALTEYKQVELQNAKMLKLLGALDFVRQILVSGIKVLLYTLNISHLDSIQLIMEYTTNKINLWEILKWL